MVKKVDKRPPIVLRLPRIKKIEGTVKKLQSLQSYLSGLRWNGKKIDPKAGTHWEFVVDLVTEYKQLLKAIKAKQAKMEDKYGSDWDN